MKLYWHSKKNKLMKKFHIISSKDLKYSIGREKEMLNKLKDKLGISEEELLSIIIDL